MTEEYEQVNPSFTYAYSIFVSPSVHYSPIHEILCVVMFSTFNSVDLLRLPGLDSVRKYTVFTDGEHPKPSNLKDKHICSSLEKFLVIDVRNDRSVSGT